MRQILARALSLQLPYAHGGAARRPRLGTEARPASVLISIAMESDEAAVLVTRRTELVETHKGQMAFPGGQRDPEDPDAIATALREAQEEVGLEPRHLEVLGSLPELPTFTGFVVTPVVAWVRSPLAKVELRAAPAEIDAMLWIRLSELERVYRRESVEHQGIRYPIDVFETGGHRIWGVTGTLLKNFLDRIQRVR